MTNPVLIYAIQSFGAEKQTIKAIEEMAELTKELAKALIGQADNTHICEEIADVQIMIDQLKIIYDSDDISEIETFRKAKIDRLSKLLDTV